MEAVLQISATKTTMNQMNGISVEGLGMTTKAKEKPILFSGPMVRAILEGRKTQTRRVVKGFNSAWTLTRFENGVLHRAGLQDGPDDIICPYEPGMRLWVRETFDWVAGTESVRRAGTRLITRRFEKIVYAADGCSKISKRWTPAIHMPRWASRILLEVTNVRAERVQDISVTDALKEGISYDLRKPDGGPVARFRSLWNTLNAKRGFGWKENPWVWVIEFKRIEA